MNIKSKRVIRMVVCLLLSTMIIACSFSVFAVDEPAPTSTPYPGTEDHPLMENNIDDVAFILWQVLESWGIKVTYQDVSGYTGDIENQIQNWVWEFLDEQPSVESIVAWIADWWYGTDFWGNLVVNDTLLEDAEAFAGWLEDKYGLTDNSTNVINPTYTYGSYNLYRTNTWYRATPYGNATPNLGDFGMFKVETVGDFLWMPVILTNGIGYIFFDDTTFSSVQVKNQTSDDTVNLNTNVGFRISARGTNGDGWYYGTTEYSENDNASWYPTGGNVYESSSNWYYWTDSSSDIMRYIQVSHIVEEGDVAIITTLISLPADNPDYIEGDGLTIIDGTPQYGEIVIPDSVSVNNLPAIIQPNKIEDPHIEQFYDFIPSFIQEAGDSMNFFKQIIFRMPDEVLYCIYAVLASGVIFGFLRILREH